MAKGRSRAFFDDIWLKVSALVISLGIWFYANSRLTEETTCQFALTVTPPQGYALVYQSTKSVRITVYGPRSLIARLDREPPRLTVKLSDGELAAGQVSLPVEQIWQRADLVSDRTPLQERDFVRLKFRKANPGEVRVFASRMDERSLPVQVRVSVHPAPGFLLATRPTVTPPEVIVRGPAIALEGLREIETKELTIYDADSDVQQPVGLELEAVVALPTGEQVAVPLETAESSVTVNASVAGERLQEQRFPNVQVLRLMPLDFPYQVEFGEGGGTVAVLVEASPMNLRKIEPARIQAYVDLSTLLSEQIPPGARAPYRERVEVKLPAGIAYGQARAEPDHVNIFLKNVPR